MLNEYGKHGPQVMDSFGCYIFSGWSACGYIQLQAGELMARSAIAMWGIGWG